MGDRYLVGGMHRKTKNIERVEVYHREANVMILRHIGVKIWILLILKRINNYVWLLENMRVE